MMEYGFQIEDNVLISCVGPIFGDETVVTVPDGVTAIGERAFWYLRGLKEIILPESVTSIGKEAFGMCEGLKRITMPGHMTTIGERAFCYCASLERIVIPDGVTAIESEAFYDCHNLKNVVFPASLKSIGMETFAKCYCLNKIKFRGTQKAWNKVSKSYCWMGPSLCCSITCTGYDENENANNPEDFVIEEGVLKRYKGNDSTVVVPEGVTTIAKNAFFTLTFESSLYRVILPEGLTTIEENAFYNHPQLSEIVIPVSLKSVPNYAVFVCFEPKKIIYRGTKAQWEEIARDIKISGVSSVECIDGKYM